MRFMVMVRANRDTEAGIMPSEALLTEMTRYNEELVKAGVMLAGEGLQPSSKGARVRFSGKRRTVVDGPFVETKELIAGFWIFQAKSRDEAIEWVKRCPNPLEGECEVEIRQVFEAEDFGAELTPELREAEERMRRQVAGAETAPAGSRPGDGVAKVYEFYIKTTPERLWQAITDPEMRARYSFGIRVRSDWTPGSRYEGTPPGAPGPLIEGENLEVDRPRRLVQSFRALWSEDVEREGTSRVTWAIEPVGDSCRLLVTHDRLREGAHGELYGGWPMILSGLKTLLETGQKLTTPGSLRYDPPPRVSP